MNKVEEVGRAIFASQEWPEFSPVYEHSSKEVWEVSAKAAIDAIKRTIRSYAIRITGCFVFSRCHQPRTRATNGTFCFYCHGRRLPKGKPMTPNAERVILLFLCILAILSFSVWLTGCQSPQVCQHCWVAGK